MAAIQIESKSKMILRQSPNSVSDHVADNSKCLLWARHDIEVYSKDVQAGKFESF
jgi:hypothetical protein